MKKRINLPEQTFNAIFPELSYKKYVSLPRKTKKKTKKRLEKELSQMIKKWLIDYERKL